MQIDIEKRIRHRAYREARKIDPERVDAIAKVMIKRASQIEERQPGTYAGLYKNE